jgi:hypothetical protein
MGLLGIFSLVKYPWILHPLWHAELSMCGVRFLSTMGLKFELSFDNSGAIAVIKRSWLNFSSRGTMHPGPKVSLQWKHMASCFWISEFETFEPIIVNQQVNLDHFADNSKINVFFQEIIHEYLSIHWTIVILELGFSEIEGTKHWDAIWIIFSFCFSSGTAWITVYSRLILNLKYSEGLRKIQRN